METQDFNSLKKKIGLILLLMTFLLVQGIAVGYAAVPKQSHEFYVYDEPNILSKQAEDYLIKVNKELYQKTGAQVVVAIVDSLDDMTIEEASVEIFEDWGIGTEGKDNGVLLLISLNDREMRIETGYGVEGAIPDQQASYIIREEIAPAFKEENYDIGIISGFDEIVARLCVEYDITIEGIDEPTAYEDGNSAMLRLGILVALYVIVMIIRSRQGPRGPGSGGTYYRPGGYRGSRTYSSGGRFGGGGFGGSSGGGGRSGGGGASGGW